MKPSQKMNIIWRDIGSVKPYPKNAKRHPDEQVQHIANSLRRFGWKQPIVIDANGVIVVGHGRVLAAKKLGMDKVPCVLADDLTEDEIKAFRLADNKTNESEWDFELVEIELDELDELDDIDMGDFGFGSAGGGTDWFESRERYDQSRQENNDEYNEFLDKFETKKTTDDCYTPDIVYEAIADWVSKEYKIDRGRMVRPFYPGGDYQAYKYNNNAVVVDNPPFSIFAEIIRYYAEAGIKFFLFAPQLTLFSSAATTHATAICIGASITYENGAQVGTSFLTNLERKYRARTCPELYQIIKAANDESTSVNKVELPKYDYCDYICTSNRLSQFSKHGIVFNIPADECVHVRELDAQKESGKAIYGSAYMVSERVKLEKEKAEREKAEREKAEREKAERWELSEREMEIVRSLRR